MSFCSFSRGEKFRDHFDAGKNISVLNSFLIVARYAFEKAPLRYCGETIFLIGIYQCSQCEYDLFSSESKFGHDTPWPAFNFPIFKDSLVKVEEPGRKGAFKVNA